jgi:integrase
MATRAAARPPRARKRATPRPKGNPMPMEDFEIIIIRSYDVESVNRQYVSRIRQVFRIAAKAGITHTSHLNEKGVAKFQVALNAELPHITQRTQRAMYEAFHAVCGRGFDRGIIAKIPDVPFIPVEISPRKERRSPLKPDDVIRLLDYLYKNSKTWDGLRLYSLVAVIVSTGLRRGEMARLRVDDVDLEGNTIRVRRREDHKWGLHPDRVPLLPELKAILAVWIPQTECSWLFPGKTLSGPWAVNVGGYESSARIHIRNAGAAVGIRKLTFDMLTRFFDQYATRRIDMLDEALRSPVPPCVEIRKGKAFIRGKPKGALSEGERLAVKALLGAFPERLTWKLLADKSGRPSVRRIVTDLRYKDAEWRDAIDLNGQSYPGSGGSVGILPW